MTKKILLTIILTSLIFSSFVFPQKSAKAEGGLSQMVTRLLVKYGVFAGISGAGSGAGSIGVPINNIAQNFQGPARGFMDTSGQIIKAVFTMFLEVAKKKLMNTLTDKIIGYTQGNGDSRFVTNWEDYSNQAYVKGEKRVIDEINVNDICPKFRDELQQTLGVSFSDNPTPSYNGFAKKLKCTEQGNLYDSLSPQNTFYGALTLIETELSARGTAQSQAAQNEALAGQGFISAKKCLEYDSSGVTCLRETIITPGQTISGLVSKAIGADIDYIINAQELEQYLTAIIYAGINRLLDKGLSDMGLSDQEQQAIGSSANKAAGGSSADTNRASLDQIINEYQNAISALNATLAIKQQTLSVAKDIVVTLTNCRQSTITAEADVSRIQQGIDTLNNLINQANALITEIQNIKQNSPNDDQAVKEVVQKFNDFINQNISTIYSGQQTAQQELSDKQKALDQAQRQCSSIINI